jgi:hypothetical protein
MVVESILRIPLGDLKTIRVTIKGVTTELPLNIDKVRDSLQLQQRGAGISDAAIGAVLALVADINSAQRQVSSDFAIEFVIPDPDSQAPRSAPTNQGGR